MTLLRRVLLTDMDFLSNRALLYADRSGREETLVKNPHFVQSGEFRTLDTNRTVSHDTDRHFTPADFFRKAGVVIAVCLALGAFLQILLT
jgi:hypothetical protein